MAKTKVSQFDATASNNTDINSVNVAEGCPPSGINNAIREMASLLKKQEVGTDAMTSPDIDGGTIDGATIGASSASTGAFTTISASGNVDFNGELDVDGTTNLDVVDIDGAVDMASTLQVDGAITSSTGMTITTADNSDSLTLTSTDADASSAPNLNMFRNSSSPATNDFLANIKFNGRNNNSQDVQYGEIEVYAHDVTDGSEDGWLNFNVMTGGTNISYLQIKGGTSPQVIFNEDSNDIDFRVESNSNTHMLFVDASSNSVSVATSENLYALNVGDNSSDNRGNFKGSNQYRLGLQNGTNDLVWLGSGGANNFRVAKANGSTALELESGGDLKIIDGNLVVASGHGIDFSANSNASGMSSEILDSYEEGSWTPAFLAASNPSVTYSIQLGHYTKIGQMVYINMRIATNGVSGGSGTLRIGGLPFSSNSTSSLISVGAVVGNSWTGEHPMKFRIINNGTDIYLYYRASLTANDLDNNSNVTDLTTASGGHNVTEITATYFTSA